MLNHEFILWILPFAYAIHVLEEKILDWKTWASATFPFPGLDWPMFYVANMAVLVGGFAAAFVGWQCPAFALIIAALMLINGLFFHILPTLVQRKFSPGVITSVVLFLPIGIWAYCGAYCDQVLTWPVLIISLVLGGLLMASPFIFFRVKAKLDKK
tara:strand:- start:10347 stop:10814 length:468 start_codon:yes stop_codon:yes gene_type:complete